MKDMYSRVPLLPETHKRLARGKVDYGTFDRFVNHLLDLHDGKLTLKIDEEQFGVYIGLCLMDLEKELFTEEEIVEHILEGIRSFVKPVTDTEMKE